MESLEAQARTALISEKCECGQPKVKRQSFCRACYFELPMTMRSNLYKPFSDGYAEIWSEAKDYLHQQTNRCSQGGLF